MSLKESQNSIVNDALIKDIRDAVKSLSFGIITIKVHETKIVQIDVTERKRFDDIWKLEGGGGI